jgi:serine/threonine protein kinase
VTHLSPQTSIDIDTPERAGPGTVVGGRYQLRAAVGHGGMGTVWRAVDTQLGRDVAVKEVVPPPGIAAEDRDAMYERMMREARAAALLSHPGVVQVYDVVTDGGRPWVVMELLDARSLAEIVLGDGPLAPRAVAKIGVALLGALEVAHAAGVLHRDVKPANVLVCTDGRCVLTDFGVARMPTDQQLTTPGMVLGSPHFISPERALGAPFGPPSDLFSLGVTLYAAVEGRPPFDKGEPIATMHAVVEDEPLPPHRAGVLADVLYGLLEKDPDRRWDAATARQVLRELLAGPLVTRTPMFPTDPYAVVPSQRLPWQEPPATAGGVGGRAMLAPGEDPLSRVDEYGTLPDAYDQVPDSYRAPDQDHPAAGRYGDPAADPYGAPAADPYGGDPAGSDGTDLPGRYGTGVSAGGSPGSPAAPQPRARADGRSARHAGAGGRTRRATGASSRAGGVTGLFGPPTGSGRGSGSSRAGALASRAGTTVGRAGAAASRAGSRALTAVRQAPRGAQVAVAAGVAGVLLVGLVWTFTRISDESGQEAGGQPPPGPPVEAPDDQPLINVQQYAGRGIVVNLPEQWQEIDNPDLVYVDFVDPAGATSQARLLVEHWEGDAAGLLDEAESNISASSACAQPYQRVSTTDIQLAGRGAVQMEYTCGQGDDARRARWATVVVDDTAYSMRLTTLDSDFAASAVIFDELLRSFQLTG